MAGRPRVLVRSSAWVGDHSMEIQQNKEETTSKSSNDENPDISGLKSVERSYKVRKALVATSNNLETCSILSTSETEMTTLG